ncbi:hypothetical protein ACFWBI_32595 [Streptomyces sp. NPDC059982]|uniref:hypothetical protein n=1 Tax=unclassified Streptomyces TaxID=2593676 RepID=UPI0036D1CD12
MTHNDKPVNGQDNPSFLDLLNQLPPVPPAPEHTAGRLAWLRAAWKESWEEGGFLYQRWEEVFQVRHSSWHEVANFLQTARCLMRHRRLSRLSYRQVIGSASTGGRPPLVSRLSARTIGARKARTVAPCDWQCRHLSMAVPLCVGRLAAAQAWRRRSIHC